MRIIGLGLVLAGFWLALSGHYTAMLVTAGLLASALSVAAARRLHIADAEGAPFQLLGGALFYWPWLLAEIVKSAANVARIIWHPKLPISPTMTNVKSSQRTAAGIATYANSITLTPGTLTVDVSGNILTVYALTREGADELERGHMDRRVSRFEGTQ